MSLILNTAAAALLCAFQSAVLVLWLAILCGVL